MRTLDYIAHAPVGTDTLQKRGTLLDLFLKIEALWHGVIPPLHILNWHLGKGRYSAGMSGSYSWEPFTLDKSEYNELVQSLLNSAESSNYKIAEVPEWVIDHETWREWTAEHGRY